MKKEGNMTLVRMKIRGNNIGLYRRFGNKWFDGNEWSRTGNAAWKRDESGEDRVGDG